MKSIFKKATPKIDNWNYRELDSDEVAMVSGGYESGGSEGGGNIGFGGGSTSGGNGAAVGTLGTVTVNGGMSPAEGASWGGLAGGAGGLRYALRGAGGFAAAGDLMGAGTIVGGVAGFLAASLGIALALLRLPNVSGPGVGNPMGDYQGDPRGPSH